MNINELAYLAQNPATLSHASKITLLTTDEFTKNLKIGQIVDGKVLQDLGQGRYLVNLGSKENIVETEIPFTKNDLLHGRVVGLGERVELQRIRTSTTKLDSQSITDVPTQPQFLLSKNEQQLVNLFNKFNASLSTKEKTQLLQSMNNTRVPLNAALAGLVIQKMGLQHSTILHAAILKVIDNKTGKLNFTHQSPQALSVAYSNADGSQVANNVQKLSEQISLFSKVFPEKYIVDNAQNNNEPTYSGTSSEDSEGYGDKNDRQHQRTVNLARWLLNIQAEGSLSHSIFSLPLIVGDKLLDIGIAIFDQKKSFSTIDGIRYRQIHFSLESEELGPVEVSLKMADNRLRINVMTESHD
ncbi:MAG TPA: hypothetical protein DDE71_04150, partial [Tenacibaculum sp.]|nr:hypothetical protein [Tenacibaculum sp.]